MNTNQEDKPNSENNASNPVPDKQTIDTPKVHKNVKTKPIGQNTVINIEDEPSSNNESNARRNYGRGRNYWVMLFGVSKKETQAEQPRSWWSYVPGAGPPTQPPRPPALNYKPETRNSFVKLVLTIVLIMIIATAAFNGFVLTTPDVKEFFQDSGWTILLPALGLLLIVDYGMMCSPCTREAPCSIIFLFLAVMGMSLLSAKVTAHYRTEIVLYAIIATAAVVFVCVLLACSNFDFTRWLLFVIVISTALSVVMIIILIVKMSTGTVMKPVIIAILVISTVLQSIVLTIQLQMILGGKSVELSESDYALGAFMIYTSIVDIFLKMVQVMGLSDSM